MMRKVIIIVGVSFSLLLAVIFWIHGNFDRIAREAIVNYGSEMTQAKVSVDQVSIDMINGKCVIKNFILANPEGFQADYAIKVKEFNLEIAPSTFTEHLILIKRIQIVAPDIIYERSDKSTNFDMIQRNIAAYLGPTKAQSPDDKKVIVNQLSIKDGKIQALAAFMNGQPVVFDLPDLYMKNLGKAENGLSPGQLGQVIVSALKKELIATVNFTKLANGALDAAADLAKTVQESPGEMVNKLKSLF